MALARAALIAAVASELAGVLTLAGFSALDTAGNMKEPVDRCFRALDVAEADLGTAAVGTGSEQKGLAFLSYFVVEKAVAATVSKMPVKAGSASAGLERQHDNLLRLLGQKLAIAQSYGLPLPGNGQSGLNPVPYAGGISQTDYDANASDSDRIPSLFSMDDLAITGVEPVAWGDPRW